MRTKRYYLVVIALLILTLTSCHTTRSVGDKARFSKRQQSGLLAPLAKYPADILWMNAKTSITLDSNGFPIIMKGRLRMRRDEVVQLSVTALGLMEIASIEFTPERAYIIDRTSKRYAQLDYSSGWLNLAGLNFNTIQALFWNRLFVPGKREPWRSFRDFSLTDTGLQCVVEPNRQRMLRCKFYTDGECNQIQQTDLTLKQYVAVWRYEDFEEIGAYAYPTTHNISVCNSSHSIGVHIEIDNISTLDTGWQSSIDLSRYKQVDLEQLISILNMIR